ncbi:MAG: hypothetical protein WC799_11335 [Desulfobacteraceae bacterium]|jgi:hypothetical protein
MDKLFNEIISIDGIIGVIIINNSNIVDYKKFSDISFKNTNDFDKYLQNSVNFDILKKVFELSNENLLIYDDLRLYVKKILNSYLLVAMKLYVPMSLIRLNCQILEPQLEKKLLNVKKFKFFSK